MNRGSTSGIKLMIRRLKYFTLLITLLSGFTVSAGDYALHVYQELPAGQKSSIPSQLMKARMQSMLTRYGFRQAARGERFIITSFVKVIERDSQPGQPSVIRLKLEINFCIGDGIDGNKIASAKLITEGSGHVEVKAYVEAYKGISAEDTQVKVMFETAKEAIKTYYSKQCSAIIKQAQELAAKAQYEQGLMKLIQIPDDCKECLGKAMEIASPIHKKYVDTNGMQLLTGAKKAWSSKQNELNAEKALKSLAEISPVASCYKDAQLYHKEISEYFTAAGKKAPEIRMMEASSTESTDKIRMQDFKRLEERLYKTENASIRYKIKDWE